MTGAWWRRQRDRFAAGWRGADLADSPYATLACLDPSADTYGRHHRPPGMTMADLQRLKSSLAEAFDREKGINQLDPTLPYAPTYGPALAQLNAQRPRVEVTGDTITGDPEWWGRAEAHVQQLVRITAAHHEQQVADAVRAVVDAWVDEGPAPEYHRWQQRQVAHQWPTLARAVRALVNATAR